MKLIIITALIAVCHTAKLDRTYLPPPSAATAGGNHNSLQAPLIRTSEDQVSPPSDTPVGSYTNEYQGVVVDAAAPGTRASSDHFSGLGAPRPSYGSTDSKVGEAAFRGSMFQGQGNAGASDLKLERPQASKDRNSNILTYSNDVNPDAYSYGFETDNGIAVGENGIDANGIQAEGGYSYQGDDGQTYKVTYVADEMGYRPQGAHLPTPPPIPEEILKSLQQNAQEEAAGVVDDGSYDAHKYNDDNRHHNTADIAYNGPQMFGNIPESDASASSSLINKNNQDLENRFGSQTQAQFNQGNQFGVNTQHNGVQGFSGSQGSHSHGVPTSQFGQQTSKFGLTNDFNSHAPQFGAQIQSTRPSGSPFGAHAQSNQPPQFGAQSQPLEASRPQFGSQVHSTQPFGSVQSQFGSQVQSTLSSGNKFGPQLQHSQSSGSQFKAQTQYTHQSGYPESQFGSQFQSTQSSGTQFGIQGQTTRPSGTQLGAHTQAPHTHQFRPQFGNPPKFDFQSNIQTKPQPDGFTDASASPSFSQSSVTPSPVSGYQFNGQSVHKPFDASSSNQYPSQNQQNNKFGASSSNINRFPQTSNRFGSNNEYLPPFNNVVSKPQFGSTNSFYINKPSQNFDSQTQTQEFQQNSAFTAPLKPNIFQTQTLSRPGQFSGNFQSSQNQQLAPSQSSLNSQTISNAKPTSIPDTELTTPLEPNDVSTSSQSTHNSQATTTFGSSSPSFSDSKPTEGSSMPNFVGSTSSFGSSTSNFGSSSSTFGSPTSNYGSPKPSFGSTTSHGGYNKQPSNQFSQFQQFSSQENLSSGSQTFLSTAPNSRPQTSGFQSGGSVNKQSNNGRPQFQQNYFNQNKFSQKPDDSYYYNQPSKPFDIPHGSSFPSSPSYQSNIGQNSQTSSQQDSFPKVPGSSISSTSATQFTQNQGSSTTFNGITQAAISPFPSVSPTLSTQFGTTQNSQFGSKPTFNQMTFSQSQSSTNQPSSSFTSRPQSQTTQNGLSNSQTDSQKQPTIQNQQYEGTIYEYNKPAETIPSSQSDSDSSQTIQSNIVSSKSEGNRPIPSQISPKPTQVNKFEQNSFTQSQQSNFNQGNSSPQFGSQSHEVPNRFGQATQFGSQTSSQHQSSPPTTISGSQSSQTNSIQGAIGLAQQPLGSTGSGYLGYPSAQDSKPQFGSNFGEISQFPTVGHPSIHQSNFNTIADDQERQNTNEQNLGLNLKPQVSQNQFGHDSQSAQTVTTQTDFPPELVSAFQSPAISSAISPYQREMFRKQQAAQAQVSSQSENQSIQPQQHTQFSHQTDQSNVESDSKPFPDTAVLSVVPSPPSKQFVPQTSAQAVVSSEPLDFLPLSTPQNQFKHPISPQPTQPSRFPSVQGTSLQGISGKGEEFGGPRQPPSFDEKTGYHY